MLSNFVDVIGTIYNRLQPILEAPPTCWNRLYS